MQYHEFVERVQQDAAINSPEQAIQIIEATLDTLQERIYRTENRQVASQLPQEIRRRLFKREKSEVARKDTDRFPLQEFYHRVQARAGVGYPEAVRQSQAVVTVLHSNSQFERIYPLYHRLKPEAETQNLI